MSRLNGWKEIATYFGKSVRAVQRWERDQGLPVHRLHTPGGEIVFAHRHELEAWERRLEGADLSPQLEAAEADGKEAGEYWANGHQLFMGTAGLTGRPVILLGGTSNDLRSATLTVLDVDHPSGSAPVRQAGFECKTCPAGRPLAYLAFRGTELSGVNSASRPTVANVAPIAGGGLRISILLTTVAVPAGRCLPAYVFYTLDSDLRPIGASMEDDYRGVHSALYLRGSLDHEFDPAETDQLWPVLSWTGERFEEMRPPGVQQ